VSAMAKFARTVDGAELRALGGDLFHPAVGLLLLLAIAVLNVYKPAGLTPYGWRKQREQRDSLQQNSRRAMPLVSPKPTTGVGVHQALRLGAATATATATATARVGYFVVHFAEMLVAMMLGMAGFVAVRLGLMALGYTVLLDASSIDFQAWMGASMAVPMIIWMRVRGCGWRDGAEMVAGMLLPVAAVLGLRGLGLGDALPWLANSEHTAMLVGMLVLMLYRRERYTSGYSFVSWPVVLRRSSGADLAEAGSAPAQAEMG